MGFLDTLNPQQKEAVLHVEGPLLILAGAGSGKTRVIISRIAHLIRNCGVRPDAILAVTFTNKASGEMRERVRRLLADTGMPPASTPLLSTFHSFCVRLLRSEGAPLGELRPGFTRSFTIYDAADQVALIKSVYKEIGLDDKFMKPRAAISVISQAKNKGRNPRDFYRDATNPQSERLAVVFEKYQEALQKSNAFDFDDLLLEAVRLLSHSADARERVRARFEHVMVDEYQDTNRPQYELLRLLVDDHENVCVVGDEDQSIYSWRGAEIRNILDFEADFPRAKTIRLEQNYRSTKRILEAAGAVVGNNLQRKGKKLWSAGEEGPAIAFYQGGDAEAEALFVADAVENHLRENPDSRAAVLYRTNSQSRQVEEAFRRFGRKYQVVGGVSFYQRAEVKDLIAYLKAALTPDDAVALLRVINTPARGIGRTTVEHLHAYAIENRVSLWRAIDDLVEQRVLGARAHTALAKFRSLIESFGRKARAEPPEETLIDIHERTGYKRMLESDPSIEAEARRENVNELLNAAADASMRDESVQEFLDHAALVSEADKIDDKAKVLLMTLHNAKGLEFPLVAVIGMEETLLPHSRSIEDETALEEERRLCYVGMTRAERQLIVTCARTRRRWGGGSPEWMAPSRFLNEIPRELMDDQTVGGARFLESFSVTEEAEAGMDLLVDQHQVRRLAEKRTFQGETYNSVESVAKFFQKKGLPFSPQGKANVSPAAPARPATGQTIRTQRRAAPKDPSGYGRGSKVRHQRYGVGTILRREGDGDGAKVTVQFRKHGLKKLVVKYAGLTPA